VKPKDLSIHPTMPTMKIGETLQLSVMVFDEHGELYLGPEPITYTSYTPHICSVSETGVVTALSPEVGLIEVSCGGRRSGMFPNIQG
jgi:hypothetical protein